MSAANAFLAVFTIQIVALSVLHPIWFDRFLRRKINPAERERDAQLYIERRLTQYRALNTGIAVLGLGLLAWLFSYLQRPDWDDGPVEALIAAYFVVQMLPLCLVSWIVARINKTLTRSLSRRKASLQRRGLFDFVSPATIVLAALVYVLFAALVMYIDQNPFPGFGGAAANIGIVTTGYAIVAIGVYVMLYRTSTNPLESHDDRMHAIGLGVKLAIFSCIGAVLLGALNMMLVLLDLQRWEPFAQSVWYVILALALVSAARSDASPRRPRSDEELRSRTRDQSA